ncbi:Acyl-CoA synthetase [Phytophthora megakarya]|uniref:Acyl-CoA synthetase n=1 Tax=Phytophthora megakarya TaxID=4795 RepID=A0A225WDG2_9STRA|nr:Acyl-CoA synthetase [Phytophthora megakarya]
MVLMATEKHWIYVPIDMELPVSRQLSLLQSAGIRHLVTISDSPLAKFFASGAVVEVDWSPFRPVQVLVLPENKDSERSFTQRLQTKNVTAPLYVLFTSGTTGKPRGVLGTRAGAWTRLEWMWKTYPFVVDVTAPLYVLFTSGTTGKPRGVLGTRAGAWTRLEWMWKTYPFVVEKHERVLRATKLSFVDSVWEIHGAFWQRIPLIHLQRPREYDAGYFFMKSVVLDDSARFLEIMRMERITRFTAVPTVLEVLLLQTIATDVRAALAGLRYMLSSGETLLLHVAQQLTDTLPDVTILNLYGSTEMSGDVTCMELKAPLSSALIAEWQQHGIPIARLDDRGVVGDDTSLVLLSDGQGEKAVSDGTSTIIWPRSTTTSEKFERGMLYVSGPLVSFGYVGCDQEVCVTSEELLDKHDDRQQDIVRGRRWFCTGDICSVTQGHLYFCGRKDNVVKIHGRRVSLEEVERAVVAGLKKFSTHTRFDDNRQVIAFTTTKEVTKYALYQQSIVVCIICNDMSNASTTRYHKRRALNGWIAKHYGISHIPHDIVVMPSTAVHRLHHGKVDRRALEILYKSHVWLPSLRPSSKRESKTETLITQLLQEILEIPLPDGRSGDVQTQTFMEIGGNSLLATLFIHELRQVFGEFSLTIQDLFEKTIQEVLLVLESQSENRLIEFSPRPMQPKARSAESIPTGNAKHRKKAHQTGSSNISGITCDALDQRSSLAYVSRYNQSSIAMGGAYVPTSFTSSVETLELSRSVAAVWQLRSVWRVNLDKCIDASPLVVQRRHSRGIVYSTWAIVGSHSAQLVCLDVQDAGTEIWKVTLDDRIEACAALSVKHSTVYVGTYAGSFVALDLFSGKERWKFQTKGTIKASAVVLDDHQLVVCGAYDNNLYGLDTINGQQRWTLDLGGSIFSTPVYCLWTEQLFAASTNNNVVALAPASGDFTSIIEQWRLHLPAPVFAGLNFYCLWTEQLFAASTNDNVVALAPASGDFTSIMEQWRLHLPAPVFAGLNADFASNLLIAGCADGQLYGISMSSGDTQWQVSTEKPIFSSPCVCNPGSVVFGSHDGMLRKVDCHSGKLLWTTNLHSAIFASPSVVRVLDEDSNHDSAEQKKHNDRLVCCVTTTAGWLYFCDESTGTVVYQTCESTGKATKRENNDNISGDLGPLFSSPVLIDNWCLLGTRTNLLYGFKMVNINTVVNLEYSNGK